jgi:hypothetical protein
LTSDTPAEVSGRKTCEEDFMPPPNEGMLPPKIGAGKFPTPQNEGVVLLTKDAAGLPNGGADLLLNEAGA